MANSHRGEIEARMDGERRVLCLTLGALAELEHAYGEDLLALAQRFESGRLSASDAISLIGAGLRGAGAAIADADVAKMNFEGGAVTALLIAVDLLKATFAVTEPPPKNP